MKLHAAFITVLVGLAVTGCATTQRETTPREAAIPPAPPPSRPTPPPRTESPRRTEPAPKPPAGSATQEGKASWYGNAHHGKKTASGETYDMNALTAAHRTLPLGTRVQVTNTENGRSVVVRINDRGPFRDSRIIDLSRAAAREIGVTGAGLFNVRLDVVEDAASEAPSK